MPKDCPSCYAQGVYTSNIADHANYPMFAQVDPNDSIFDGYYRGVKVELDAFARNYPKQTAQLIDLGLSVKDKQVQINAIWQDKDAQKKYIEAFKIDHGKKLVTLGQGLVKANEGVKQTWAKIESLDKSINTKTGKCEWYDIPCHFSNFAGNVGTIALIGVGAFLVYNFVIKRKK